MPDPPHLLHDAPEVRREHLRRCEAVEDVGQHLVHSEVTVQDVVGGHPFAHAAPGLWQANWLRVDGKAVLDCRFIDLPSANRSARPSTVATSLNCSGAMHPSVP